MTRLQILSCFTLLVNCFITITSISEKEFLDQLMNVCIDSDNHKSKPGPEDELHSGVSNITSLMCYGPNLSTLVSYCMCCY